MRIQQIAVTELFGRFDHVINLDSAEKVTIMTGPNGSGKTMILRLVYALFNEVPRQLTQIPFRNVRLSLDNGSILEAERILDSNKVEIRLLAAGRTTLTYLPAEVISATDIDFPTGLIEDIVPHLDQIGATEWRYQVTGELLGLDEVFS